MLRREIEQALLRKRVSMFGKPAAIRIVIIRHRVGANAPPDDRLQRMIQYSRALVMEPRIRGVLDVLSARLRGHDG